MDPQGIRCEKVHQFGHRNWSALEQFWRAEDQAPARGKFTPGQDAGRRQDVEVIGQAVASHGAELRFAIQRLVDPREPIHGLPVRRQPRTRKVPLLHLAEERTAGLSEVRFMVTNMCLLKERASLLQQSALPEEAIRPAGISNEVGPGLFAFDHDSLWLPIPLAVRVQLALAVAGDVKPEARDGRGDLRCDGQKAPAEQPAGTDAFQLAMALRFHVVNISQTAIKPKPDS